MTLALDRGAPAPQGPIVADRHLYLDATGTKLVEHGDAASASQLVGAGRPIDQADVDRLGLTVKDGKVVQDHPAAIADFRAIYDKLVAEKTEFDAKVEQYKHENAVRDIPNTMEHDRVQLNTRVEAARMTLAQVIKAAAGKDPLSGESQATSVRPEASATATAASKRARQALAGAPSTDALARSAPKTAEKTVAAATSTEPPAAKKPARKRAAKK